MADENEAQEVMVIVLKRQPWEVAIGGNIQEPYLRLAMLSNALKLVEMEIAYATSVALSQQRSDNQRVQSILDVNYKPRGNA